MSLNWGPWSTVRQMVAAPRGVVTSVGYSDISRGGDGVSNEALFVTDSSNVIRMTSTWCGIGVVPNLPVIWAGWIDVAGGQAPPGSPVTVVPWGEWPFAVFVTGLDGTVYTTAGGYQQGFPGGWAAMPIANTQALPGSPVTVVGYGEYPFEVFVTGLDGVIYTAVGNPQVGFDGWATVAQGQAPPGSSVTVVPWGEWPFAVFVTGLDGTVYTTAGGFQQGFPGGWAPVPGITAPPGSPVTVFPALDQQPPGLDQQLFVTGLDGVIYTTVGNPQTGFPGGWSPVPGITAPPGSPVTGGQSEPFPQLYATDVNGGVYTTADNGSNWYPVVQPQGTAAPGSPVTLGDHLFVTSPQGEVLFTGFA